MIDSSPRTSTIFRLFSDLSALISKEWQLLATLLVRALPYLLVERNRGMYEILDYEITLDLKDAKGRKAVFEKRQTVRFLQHNIIAFQDYAWGDGDVFTSYTCTPGQVVDRYREGDRWNILISLRQTKGKGDIETFHIQRTATNGFMADEEWLQTEIRHPTRRLRLSHPLSQTAPLSARLCPNAQHQPNPDAIAPPICCATQWSADGFLGDRRRCKSRSVYPALEVVTKKAAWSIPHRLPA